MPQSIRFLMAGFCNRLSLAVLCLILVGGPWLFGSTMTDSIRMWNLASYFLGSLLLLQVVLGAVEARRRRGERWANLSRAQIAICSLAVLGMLGLLLFASIYVINARMVFVGVGDGGGNLAEYLECISWLPHSYNKNASMLAVQTYAGLFFIFWSTLVLVVGGSRNPDGAEGLMRVPMTGQLRFLLWVLTINGALLALEGILQRLSGTDMLLWMVQPHLNRDAASQFGPFAYRSNAAQYLNLVWPCSVGFWWVLKQEHRHRQVGRVVGDGSHMLVFLCALVMAVAPFVTTSRGGIAVGLMLIAGCAVIVGGVVGRTSWKKKLMVSGSCALVVGIGCFLGWDQLKQRLKWDSTLSGRTEIYANAHRIVEDHPVFGTGPGTFATVYQHYMEASPNAVWPAYVHDDWLQTRLEWGKAGSWAIYALVFLFLMAGFLGRGEGGPSVLVGTIMLGLIGCLVHAKYDFPFQVHSIQVVYVVLSAIVFGLGLRAMASRRPTGQAG